jgi:DNA-binding MarR family transcriptional regulator
MAKNPQAEKAGLAPDTSAPDTSHPDARPPDASHCHATALRKASRRLTQLYDDALEPCGLRSTQFAILAELSHQATSPTLAELAQALVMDRSSLGHNLRPLERDGLIELQEGEEDRRRRHIVLTRAGKSKVAAAKRLWLAAQERFTATFGEAQATSLSTILLGIANDERLARLKD